MRRIRKPDPFLLIAVLIAAIFVTGSVAAGFGASFTPLAGITALIAFVVIFFAFAAVTFFRLR